MATQAYWKLLLAQVKPLPRFFSQLDFAVAAEAQARTHASCHLQRCLWTSEPIRLGLECA